MLNNKQVLAKCKEWMEAPSFSAVVFCAVELMGYDFRKQLADEFDVAESTVMRWELGTAKPLERMREQIVYFIMDKILEAQNQEKQK